MSKPDHMTLRKRVKLLKPHRHAGRDYKPEQFLELPESKAAWLISVGTAEAAPTDTAQATRVAAAAPSTKIKE